MIVREQIDRNCDGERDFCRQILIVAIKDAVSTDNNKYAYKHRNSAIRWFSSVEESNLFCFNRVIEYIYGDDVDIDGIRSRVLKIIDMKKVSGVKNLCSIFQVADEQ